MALNPTSSRGDGSSYTAPTSREEWSGNGVAIAHTAFDWLTWNSSGGPDAVLDNAVPAHPTVGVAGVYCVSAAVRTTPGDPGGFFDIGLFLDRAGFNASQTVTIYGNPVSGLTSDTTVAFAWYLPVGGKVEVAVTYTGTGTHAAASCSIISAHIQRLS
jgi:hypothetical protein